jgi:hypothetical protein
MSRQRLIGVFATEKDLLAVVPRLRQEGFALHDIQTPYAVHGLDEAAGLRRSRIGWVCAIAGLTAAAAMLGFQEWVSALAWPLNVGGKPFSSTPAFVPVLFEVGVLTGGLTTVLAFFLVSRLFPGKKPKLAHSRVTDDRFVVVLEASASGPEGERAALLCRQHHAVEVGQTSLGASFGGGVP